MAGIIRPFYYGPAKHIYQLLTNDQYRKLVVLQTKLAKFPRFQETEIKIDNWKLIIPDIASFISTYREIFVERIYDFKFSNSTPRILDLGANIGLSVLFFKTIFPNADIYAYEADPNIFKILKHNLTTNGFQDVKIYNSAVWNQNTMLMFNPDGADGGHVITNSEKNDNLIQVTAVDISKILDDNPVDFLKMDIEGAEEVVLPACGAYLHKIQYIFIEYHSKPHQKQHIDKIINVISKAGFRIHIHPVRIIKSPFINKINSDFDMQLNIFGTRD